MSVGKWLLAALGYLYVIGPAIGWGVIRLTKGKLFGEWGLSYTNSILIGLMIAMVIAIIAGPLVLIILFW